MRAAVKFAIVALTLAVLLTFVTLFVAACVIVVLLYANRSGVQSHAIIATQNEKF